MGFQSARARSGEAATWFRQGYRTAGKLGKGKVQSGPDTGVAENIEGIQAGNENECHRASHLGAACPPASPASSHTMPCARMGTRLSQHPKPIGPSNTGSHLLLTPPSPKLSLLCPLPSHHLMISPLVPPALSAQGQGKNFGAPRTTTQSHKHPTSSSLPAQIQAGIFFVPDFCALCSTNTREQRTLQQEACGMETGGMAENLKGSQHHTLRL